MAEIIESEVRQQVAAEQRRPDISAESFSPRMRLGLLFFTLVGIGMLVAMVVAASVLPHGLLDLNPFLGVYIGGLFIGLGFHLMIIFGGLVGNNPRLDEGAKLTWFMLFATIGPIALPAYWFMHVWPAPYEPWTDPEFIPESPATNHPMPAHA